MKNFCTDRFYILKGTEKVWIYFTKNSGRIIFRDKIDTLMGFTHPGIILGVNSRGEEMVIHNHYQIGYPEIVTLKQFTLGSKYYFDPRKVFYNTKQIIERAIASWMEKKPYTWLTYNCQHFVNKVAANESRSEAIDKIADGALAIGGLTSLFGLLTGNGNVVKAGLTIAGAGVAGKALNS